MSDKPKAASNEMTYRKGFLIAAGIMSASIAFIGLNMLLGLKECWLSFVIVTMWSAFIGNNVDEIPKAWIGSVVGILASSGLWLFPGYVGYIGGTIGALLLFITILGGMVSNKCTLICNPYAFVVLNIFTAKYFQGAMDHYSYLPDVAFGALIMGVLPYAIIKLKARKKAVPVEA